MDLPSVRAVLLDVDGTLVDSDASIARAWTTGRVRLRAAALATTLRKEPACPRP